MVELGELEAHHTQFEERGTQVVVVSMEDQDKAKQTQAEFPHLKVVADADGACCKSLGLIHAGVTPEGQDAAAPTTILSDGNGTVRWLFRPTFHINRLTPAELLAAIDTHLDRAAIR